jgi:hypothetical protein
MLELKDKRTILLHKEQLGEVLSTNIDGVIIIAEIILQFWWKPLLTGVVKIFVTWSSVLIISFKFDQG